MNAGDHYEDRKAYVFLRIRVGYLQVKIFQIGFKKHSISLKMGMVRMVNQGVVSSWTNFS